MCLATVLVLVFWRLHAAYGILGTIVLVSLETVYILVSALWRQRTHQHAFGIRIGG